MKRKPRKKHSKPGGSIGGYYTVKRGDTLAGISKKMYQSYNYIEMIAEANGIDNVDEIYPRSNFRNPSD